MSIEVTDMPDGVAKALSKAVFATSALQIRSANFFCEGRK